MTAIRVHEPYFKFLIKQKWCELFGILMNEEEIENSSKYLNDTLSTFLASSLNIELVNIILQGVTRFADYPIEINIQNNELESDCDRFKV